MELKKDDKQTIKAWTFYDWANSVFPLVITSAIFPNFYDAVTSTKDEAGNVISQTVTFFGTTFENNNIYSFVYAFALFIVVLIAPILSGVADYLGNKKGTGFGFQNWEVVYSNDATNQHDPLKIPLELFPLFRKFEERKDPEKLKKAAKQVRAQAGQRGNTFQPVQRHFMLHL